MNGLNKLRMINPLIDRDAKVLENLRDAIRWTIADRRRWKPLQTHPSLYRKNRGSYYPFFNGNRNIQHWRYLTHWMKFQIALLVLGDGNMIQFRGSIHAELLDELRAKGVDLRVYLRNRLARCLRQELGAACWFLFVIEDRDKSGQVQIAPHIHGIMRAPDMPFPVMANGLPTAKWRRKIAHLGIKEARIHYGLQVARAVLKRATGNSSGRPTRYKGRGQGSNIWVAMGKGPLFDTHSINYAFKNVGRSSTDLADNRIHMCRPLSQEAQRLWKLMAEGESAMSQWS